MKFGIGTYCTTWMIGVPNYPLPQHPLQILQLLDIVHEYGLHLVQIADNFPLYSIDNKELLTISNKAEQLEISIEIGLRGSDPIALLRYLEIAEIFHSSIVRTLLTHESLEMCKKELLEVLPKYEEAGVKLALENHGLHASGELAEFIRSFHSPVIGCCLDTVNSFGSLEGPEVVIDNLLLHTINLHLKDFIVKRHTHQMGFEIIGTPAGEGKLPIVSLIQKIECLAKKNNRPAPTIILENWVPWQGNIEDTVVLEKQWLDKSIQYLKTLE